MEDRKRAKRTVASFVKSLYNSIERERPELGQKFCYTSTDGFSCTRPVGHAGPHIAQGPKYHIYRIWET